MVLRITCSLRTGLVVLVLGWTQLAWSQQTSAPPSGNQIKPGESAVISVDDEKMTAADVEKFLEALPPDYRAYYGGPGKSQLPQYLVQMKVLAAEARRENLQDRPEVKEAVEIARNSILADAARKRFAESISVSDGQLRELYQKRKAEFEEVRVRRILMRTAESPIAPPAAPARTPLPAAEVRKKLEDLRKQILAGGDFAELAQANSDDLATAGAGGDMGYINQQKVVPPVAQAAYALSLGQVSEIINTPYGLELIKVEEKRVKPLAEVKSELEAQIRQDKLQEMLQRLVAQHRVVVEKDFFTPPKKTSAPAQSSSTPQR